MRIGKKCKHTKPLLFPIQYPKHINHGFRVGPTPAEKLLICDGCHSAEWTIHSNIRTSKVCYPCRKRMREATPEEYVAGRNAIVVSTCEGT